MFRLHPTFRLWRATFKLSNSKLSDNGEQTFKLSDNGEQELEQLGTPLRGHGRPQAQLGAHHHPHPHPPNNDTGVDDVSGGLDGRAPARSGSMGAETKQQVLIVLIQ